MKSTRFKPGLSAVLSALILAFVSASCAEKAAEPPPPPGLSAEQGEAILKELQAMRELLEKIEQKSPAQQARRQRPTTAKVSFKGAEVLGDPDAPVTVVEFTDFQCPYCKRFIDTTFDELRKKYIDTGKVRWYVRNLALSFHQDARKAAQAAHCAGDQGKYWDMRAVLFRNARNLKPDDLRKYAAGIGLDMELFNACLDSDRHLARIDRDGKDANTQQLTGTPSFVIGKADGDWLEGKLVIGAQPERVFSAAIDNALKVAGKQTGATAKGS